MDRNLSQCNRTGGGDFKLLPPPPPPEYEAVDTSSLRGIVTVCKLQKPEYYDYLR
jgi:hypothetical protein